MIGGDRLSTYILSVVSKKFTTLGSTINNINGYLMTQLATLNGLITTVQSDITTVQGVQTTLNAMFADFNPKYTNFVALWYGPLASDPTTDALGNPPLLGAQYYNTTSSVPRLYVGVSTDFPTGWRDYDAEAAATAAANAAATAQQALTEIAAYGLVYPSTANENYILTISADGTTYQARSAADTLTLLGTDSRYVKQQSGTNLTPVTGLGFDTALNRVVAYYSNGSSIPLQRWGLYAAVNGNLTQYFQCNALQMFDNASSNGSRADLMPVGPAATKWNGTGNLGALVNSAAILTGDPANTGVGHYTIFQGDGRLTLAANGTGTMDAVSLGQAESTFVQQYSDANNTLVTKLSYNTALSQIAALDTNGVWHYVQPAGSYALQSDLTNEISRAQNQETILQSSINTKANLNGGNTFTGTQLVPAVSSWTSRQIVDAQSATDRFALLNGGNLFIGNQSIKGVLKIVSGDGANNASIYSDTSTTGGGNDLVINNGSNYTIFGQDGSIVSTLKGSVVFVNGSNRIVVPGGTVAYTSDISTVTTSGNPGDANSWTMIKTVDPSTPSGYRIRYMGETGNFTGEGAATITFPFGLNGIFPGSWGTSTQEVDGDNASTNDNMAQVRGTPTKTQIVIEMNYFGGGTAYWPMRALWWIEGY